jgi:hypothetical protein
MVGDGWSIGSILNQGGVVMSDLRPNLFDTDFDNLITLGRALLPKHAPLWTDHNFHDPGIMLIELLAWTAEAQIYSLARLRTDERWAYGALLGIESLGSLPAQGLIWPDLDIDRNSILKLETQITAEQPQAPAFRLSYPINLTKAELVGVESRLQDGRLFNYTETNKRKGASFYPFGEQAGEGDRFVLRFQGPLLAPKYYDSKTALLALGIRVPPPLPLPGSDTPTTRSADVDTLTSTSQLVANLISDQLVYPLRIEVDSTDGLLRTGVILLDLSNVPEKLGNSFAIEFKSLGSGMVGPPRILYIKPNVLPIIQQQTERPDFSGWSSSDLPDRYLKLENSQFLYSKTLLHRAKFCSKLQRTSNNKDTEDELKLSFGGARWTFTDDLSVCGPDDTVFTYDPETGQIRFGNGINGKIPPTEIPPQLEYQITEGPAGNLPAGLKWKVEGVGHFGINEDTIQGGADAIDLMELRRIARERIRKTDTIVTSSDLERAAYALPDLRVARAQALPIPDVAKNCSVFSDRRTLVALRDRLPDSMTPESPFWLGEIQRQLTPRLLLGERLKVVAPDYVPLQIQATLLARPSYDPKAIEQQVLQMLEKLFTLVPNTSTKDVWPLGQPVELLEIKAKLRQIDGVSGVTSCELLWGDPPSTIEQQKFSKTFLPLWQRPQSQIKVERMPIGSIP